MDFVQVLLSSYQYLYITLLHTSNNLCRWLPTWFSNMFNYETEGGGQAYALGK